MRRHETWRPITQPRPFDRQVTLLARNQVAVSETDNNIFLAASNVAELSYGALLAE